MYKKCEGHGRFELAPKMRVDHQFCVRHYAGKVVYSTEGIIDKNRDTLQQEGIDMLLSSGSDFTVLMGEIESKSTKVWGGGGGRVMFCCAYERKRRDRLAERVWKHPHINVYGT